MILPRYINEIPFSSFFDFRGIQRYNKFKTKYPFIYNSGTSALYAALINLNIPKDATIGVPLYSCYSVWHTVYKAGYNIKFLDIGISNSGYSYNIDDFDDIDVLVFIHYFGFLNTEIEKIRLVKPSLIIINDMTHVVFQNNTLQTNISIYSFNFHKPIVAGAGGLLTIDNERMKKNIEKKYLDLKEEKFVFSVKKYVKTFFKNSIYFPIIYTVLYEKVIKNRENIFIAPDLNMDIIPKKLHPIFQMIVGNQVEHYERGEYTSNYKKLPDDFRLPVREIDILSYFPIFAKNIQHRDKLLRFIEDMKIDHFLLWKNTLNSVKFYGLTDYTEYKKTQSILNNTIFLPQPLFLNKNKDKLEKFIKEMT